jgi:heme O synthase-like polyprenyltransferase
MTDATNQTQTQTQDAQMGIISLMKPRVMQLVVLQRS